MVDVMIMVVVAPNLENISKINHVVVIMASVVLLRHIVGLYVPIKLWYGSNDRYDEKYGKFKIEKCWNKYPEIIVEQNDDQSIV